jgi:hypothetical protein
MLMLLGVGSAEADIPQAVPQGFCKGRSLMLPRGEVVAEDGVQHSLDSRAVHTVAPVSGEAYVVVKLPDHTQWYATWLPYSGEWELLRLESSWLEPEGPELSRAA